MNRTSEGARDGIKHSTFEDLEHNAQVMHCGSFFAEPVSFFPLPFSSSECPSPIESSSSSVPQASCSSIWLLDPLTSLADDARGMLGQ